MNNRDTLRQFTSAQMARRRIFELIEEAYEAQINSTPHAHQDFHRAELGRMREHFQTYKID